MELTDKMELLLIEEDGSDFILNIENDKEKSITTFTLRYGKNECWTCPGEICFVLVDNGEKVKYHGYSKKKRSLEYDEADHLRVILSVREKLEPIRSKTTIYQPSTIQVDV